MPIRQDENQPNKRFGIINLVLIGFGALLLFSSFFPSQNTQVPRVPYSLFINQVDDGEVKRAYITQDQIRYELSTAEEGAPSVLATTPIFDMELPQRLEKKRRRVRSGTSQKTQYIYYYSQLGCTTTNIYSCITVFRSKKHGWWRSSRSPKFHKK
jgi:ATP-dependent Zn protease